MIAKDDKLYKTQIGDKFPCKNCARKAKNCKQDCKKRWLWDEAIYKKLFYYCMLPMGESAKQIAEAILRCEQKDERIIYR